MTTFTQEAGYNSMPHLYISNQQGQLTTLEVAKGTNLRKALLKAEETPYTRLTETLNCGGRGLCATCGVIIHENPQPNHWHDKLAKLFRYPRLSCQITVTTDMHVEIPKKMIWGKRIKKN